MESILVYRTQKTRDHRSLRFFPKFEVLFDPQTHLLTSHVFKLTRLSPRSCLRIIGIDRSQDQRPEDGTPVGRRCRTRWEKCTCVVVCLAKTFKWSGGLWFFPPSASFFSKAEDFGEKSTDQVDQGVEFFFGTTNDGTAPGPTAEPLEPVARRFSAARRAPRWAKRCSSQSSWSEIQNVLLKDFIRKWNTVKKQKVFINFDTHFEQWFWSIFTTPW